MQNFNGPSDDGDMQAPRETRVDEPFLLGKMPMREMSLQEALAKGIVITADGGNVNRSQDPWAHRSAGMKCATCMWFVEKQRSGPTNADRFLGRCRRHAPTMNGFPAVFNQDWCGDHKLGENKT